MFPIFSLLTLMAWQSPLEQAWNHVKSGDYLSAEQGFSALITQNPDEAEAYLGRGQALKELGRGSEAMADFQRCLKLAEANHNAHINKARPVYLMAAAYHQLKQNDKAVEAIKKAINLDPNSEDYQTFYDQLRGN